MCFLHKSHNVFQMYTQESLFMHHPSNELLPSEKYTMKDPCLRLHYQQLCSYTSMEVFCGVHFTILSIIYPCLLNHFSTNHIFFTREPFPWLSMLSIPMAFHFWLWTNIVQDFEITLYTFLLIHSNELS